MCVWPGGAASLAQPLRVNLHCYCSLLAERGTREQFLRPNQCKPSVTRVRRASEYLLQGRDRPELPYFSANSTAMRAVPTKVRLKYFTACSASSTVRKPTKPN